MQLASPAGGGLVAVMITMEQLLPRVASGGGLHYSSGSERPHGRAPRGSLLKLTPHASFDSVSCSSYGSNNGTSSTELYACYL